MRAALTDEDAFDFRAANIASLAGALVDLEVILKAAPAVDPIDAGAIAANPFLQYVAYRQQKAFGFLASETVGETQRVQPGQVQGFVGVDVAHARQEVLVEQQRLDLAFVLDQAPVKVVSGESFVKGFGTEIVQYFGRVVGQPHPSKFARVDEDQTLPAGKVEGSAVVGLQGQGGSLQIKACFHAQVAAHAQVDDEGVPVQMDEDVFAAPSQALDGLAGQAGIEFFDRW